MESTLNDMLSMMHHHNELDVDQQHAAPRAFASIRPDPKDGIASLLNDNDVDAEPRQISDKEVDTYKEQDRFLPIANVGRIMKKCLPTTTKVSKDAKECVQECTSEFISFITSEAAERCLHEKRKTINGEDILFAMTTLGFENYADTLKIYLAKYRDYQRTTGRRVSKKMKLAHAQGEASSLPTYLHDDQEGAEDEGDEEDDAENGYDDEEEGPQDISDHPHGLDGVPKADGGRDAALRADSHPHQRHSMLDNGSSSSVGPPPPAPPPDLHAFFDPEGLPVGMRDMGIPILAYGQGPEGADGEEDEDDEDDDEEEDDGDFEGDEDER